MYQDRITGGFWFWFLPCEAIAAGVGDEDEPNGPFENKSRSISIKMRSSFISDETGTTGWP
jgi:hypothetical protein